MPPKRGAKRHSKSKALAKAKAKASKSDKKAKPGNGAEGATSQALVPVQAWSFFVWSSSLVCTHLATSQLF